MTKEATIKELPSVDVITQRMDNVQTVLKKMGYTSLREGQEAPINNILMERDTICVLPTGGGKSAVFAIPAIACEWKTVVFSPLIALMADQVQSMRKMGLRAGCISSNQTDVERINVMNSWSTGNLDILYVSPERIANPQFQIVMDAVPPEFVALDEAHTLSQWSDNFRPAYHAISKFVEKYNPKVIAAMTATATTEVIQDIRRVMCMKEAQLFKHYPARTNLKLTSSTTTDASIIDDVLTLIEPIKGSKIIYCQTVKMVKAVFSKLEFRGVSVVMYHGQMDPTDRDVNQDLFMSGEVDVVVATNAFGMGIDKPDIRCVIHIGMPGSIEAVSQEVGRAARDGGQALCHMFRSADTDRTQEYFWDLGNPTGSVVHRLFALLDSRQDAEGVLKMTQGAMAASINEKEVGSAVSYLVALGCITSEPQEVKLCTFIVPKSIDFEELPDKLKDPMGVITGYGTIVKESEKTTTYEIEQGFLQQKIGKAPTTVNNYLKELHKEGYVHYIPPFRGNVTRVLRRPTAEELSGVDVKRKTSYENVKDVIKYHSIPDEEKHNFLQAYFHIENEGKID